MRELATKEKAVTLALAEAVGQEKERNQLMLDIQNCMVEDIVSDGSMLRFHISGYERPLQHVRDTLRGRDGFPVEGSIFDEDGGEMDVLIFCDQNKRVLELELVKHVGGPVLGPDWNGFRLK